MCACVCAARGVRRHRTVTRVAAGGVLCGGSNATATSGGSELSQVGVAGVAVAQGRAGMGQGYRQGEGGVVVGR